MNLRQFFLASVLLIASTVAISQIFFPVSKLVIDEAKGEVLFADNCAGCHSLETGGPLLRGPSLYSIGAWASSRVTGLSAEEYVFESIVVPDAYRIESAQGMMPGRFGEELTYQDILNVTAFLVGKSKPIDYKALLRNELPPIEASQAIRPTVSIRAIERGEQLYQNLCMTCHEIEVGQNYDLYYPNLRQVGVHDRSYLLESILDPSKSIPPGYDTWTVQSQGGEPITGRLVYEDATQLTLVVANSNGFVAHKIAKTSLVPYENGDLLLKSPYSDMPPLGLALSEQELEDLVRFLTFL